MRLHESPRACVAMSGKPWDPSFGVKPGGTSRKGPTTEMMPSQSGRPEAPAARPRVPLSLPIALAREPGKAWELLHVADGLHETNEGFHYSTAETRFDEVQVWIVHNARTFQPCSNEFNPPGVTGEPAALTSFFFDQAF